MPTVSIIIVTHNSQDDIVDCVNSVLFQDYQNFEVIIVDNASTDKTVDIIKQNFGSNSAVRLICSKENTWYPGGNNLGFHYSNGDFIVILNPDLIVDKLWLTKLLETYDSYENVGIVCSNVLLFDDHDVINACGNDIHLTGFVFSRFYGEDRSKCSKEEVVAAPSGASFIFSRKKLNTIGRKEPFDNARFVMEYSDHDLAIDFLNHDLLCYVAPSSKVYHKFKFKMNPRRLYDLEVGRYQILGHLTKRTLFLMLPALVVAELIVWSFVLTKDRRLIKPKLKVQIQVIIQSRGILRSDNSSAKDLKLIQYLIQDIKLYDELKGSSTHVQMTLNAANRIFGFTRRLIINSLHASLKIK